MAAPRTVKKPTDHQAKAEAKSQDVVVEYDGHTYVIPRENADDVELFEEIEADHAMTALKGFIGPEQWAYWKNSHRGPNGKVSINTELEPFLNAIMAAIGGGSKEESPNSSASPTS